MLDLADDEAYGDARALERRGKWGNGRDFG